MLVANEKQVRKNWWSKSRPVGRAKEALRRAMLNSLHNDEDVRFEKTKDPEQHEATAAERVAMAQARTLSTRASAAMRRKADIEAGPTKEPKISHVPVHRGIGYHLDV